MLSTLLHMNKSHVCHHTDSLRSHLYYMCSVVCSVLQYYSLDVSFFKSGLDSHLLDLLWNKYWVNTLSTSPLIANREFAAGQIADIAEKLEQVMHYAGDAFICH